MSVLVFASLSIVYGRVEGIDVRKHWVEKRHSLHSQKLQMTGKHMIRRGQCGYKIKIKGSVTNPAPLQSICFSYFIFIDKSHRGKYF